MYGLQDAVDVYLVIDVYFLRFARDCFFAADDKFLEQLQTEFSCQFGGIDVFFHSPYKLVHVGCRPLLFFKSLRKIRNPFFQFRLLCGVLVYQLQAHIFGDLACDLFFERRAYELIEFRNAPFRSLEFSFDVGLVFVREPCGIHNVKSSQS